jgi:hypothetical protein
MHDLMTLKDVVVAKTKMYKGTGLADEFFDPQGAQDSASGHSILDSDLLVPPVQKLTPQELEAINRTTRALRGGR